MSYTHYVNYQPSINNTIELRAVLLKLVPLIIPIFINRLILPRKTNYSIYFD